MGHSEIMLKLFMDLIQTLALENPRSPDLVYELDELTLGITMAQLPRLNSSTLLNANTTLGPFESSQPAIFGAIRESELLAFGVPARHHLDLAMRRHMFEEIQSTLRSIAEFFFGDQESVANEDLDVMTRLPETIQAYKIGIENKKHEASLSSQRVAKLIDQINVAREGFDRELRQAVSITLPTHDATRTSSIDLLAATIEMSLIKLSLTRARAERALYNHQPRNAAPAPGANVAKAIEAAYQSLKKDENEMKVQSQSLDRQLHEYESLMQLVDGGKGGYQQVIDDWTKVQQETDECLKDLRRLGWTGD